MSIAPKSRTPLEVAAERLREISLASENGTFIGSEEALIHQLGCARATARQVARLLEREGLLKVRRGMNGGYFSARPDAGTIEATVSAYLETLDMEPSDVTVLASALWVEAVRKAANRNIQAIEPAYSCLKEKIAALNDEATFDMVRALERETQDTIFLLAQSDYIKLIFDINSAFSRRRFAEPLEDDASPEHKLFVREWRNSKLLELSAIGMGDSELAVLGAQLSRKIWHSRLKRRFITLTPDQSEAG